MAALSKERFWTEFFEMYKNLPELWNKNSVAYKNKAMKNNAYKTLATKLEEITPNVTAQCVKVKLAACRSSYRRELKRVENSKKCAINGEEVYKPSLYYYDNLSFLEQFYRNKARSETDSATDSCEDTKRSKNKRKTSSKRIFPQRTSKRRKFEQISSEAKASESRMPELDTPALIKTEPSTPEPAKPEPEFPGLSISAPRTCESIVFEPCTPEPVNYKNDLIRIRLNTLLDKALNHLEQHEAHTQDEIDIHAASWATLFRKLNPQQQLYANKTIMEVLYQGALGTLNEHSYKALEPVASCYKEYSNS